MVSSIGRRSTYKGVECPHVNSTDLDPGLVGHHGGLELAAIGYGPGAIADPDVGGPDERVQHVTHNPTNNQRVPVPATGHVESELVLGTIKQGCLVCTGSDLQSFGLLLAGVGYALCPTADHAHFI